jgi:hypothetical protein
VPSLGTCINIGGAVGDAQCYQALQTSTVRHDLTLKSTSVTSDVSSLASLKGTHSLLSTFNIREAVTVSLKYPIESVEPLNAKIDAFLPEAMGYGPTFPE